MKRDLYKELGVPRNADAKAIKKAFRHKAKELHPDKSGGDSSEFIRLQLAYSVLSEDAKRKRYDETGDTGERSVQDRECYQILIQEVLKCCDNEFCDDPLLTARNNINAVRVSMLKDMEGGRKKAKQLRYRAARFSRKDGQENLISAALNHQATQIEQNIRLGEERAKLLLEAAKMADAYRYEAEHTGGGTIVPTADAVAGLYHWWTTVP